MPRFAKSGILKASASAAAVWVVYNGCVAYALTGAMLQVEYIARRIARNG